MSTDPAWYGTNVEQRRELVARIYEQSYGDLVRMVYLIVRSTAVAEEIVQDAFVQLFKHRRPIDNPEGFLRTAATRLALSWLRRGRNEVRKLALIDRRRPVPPPAEPDEMWCRLDALSPKLRAVLVLRFYLDLSHEQIAATLGCRPSTARSRLHRALATLKEDQDEY